MLGLWFVGWPDGLFPNIKATGICMGARGGWENDQGSSCNLEEQEHLLEPRDLAKSGSSTSLTSAVLQEKGPRQHWKQQAGRVREEHILWFLSSTLRFWSFLPREMWGGSKPHVVAVPTKWCLGDLSMLCENQSRPLLGLPCLLCGTKGFWSCDGWPRAVGQRGGSSLCLVTRLVAPASQNIFNAGLPRLADDPPDLDSQLQTPSVQ